MNATEIARRTELHFATTVYMSTGMRAMVENAITIGLVIIDANGKLRAI